MKRIFLLTSFMAITFTQAFFAMGSTQPALSRVNATPFVGQVQEYNNAGIQGALDTSFGTSGSLSINAQLTGGQAKAIQVLSDGTFVVALSKASVPSVPSVIAKYNAEGTVASSTFGSSGVASLGSATLSAQAMMVDAQGRIVVAGGNDGEASTAGWLKRVSADGNTVVSFSLANAWRFIGGLAQQTSGKIIAVGSNNSFAQIARYTVGTSISAGILDTTFGTAGTIVFNDTVTSGLYSIVVDSSDNIYVAYLDGTAAKVAKFDINGNLVTGFGTDGIAAITYLNTATASQIRIAIDSVNDLVIGAQVGSVVKVTSITSASGAVGSLADFTTPSDTLNALSQVIPTSDGKVLLVGSDTVSPYNMAVMRLTSAGLLDASTASFNLPFNTNGYNLFAVGTPFVASVLYGASVTPDGQLLAVGYQSSGVGPTITPYVSRLYNAPFISAVSQFPVALEQGILDTTFGTNATQSFRGVTMPYNGSFGSSLLQQTRAIVELASGGFLIGSDGYDGSSGYKSMMLTWLTSAGVLDTSFGNSTGKLTLTNVSTSDETMADLAVGTSNFIYIVGTNATPLPFIRSYTYEGAAITSLNDTGIASVGIAIQGSAGILLFAQDDSTTGHISRYTTSGGTLALDTASFGQASSGKIATDALGLDMGPVYGGGLVNAGDEIVIAYQSTNDPYKINLAMINKNGTGLISEFGHEGIVSNIFPSVSFSATNVRTAFAENGNIFIATTNAAGTRYLLTCYDGVFGFIDPTFNGGTVLTITPESVVTSLTLTNVIGVSNGAVMLTGYDQATNPVMLTMRVVSASNVASLDTTFNSQGAVPGVVSIQIENETANYNARVATSLAIQSHTGGNQGNLVYSAYEQQISSQSTPESFRLFGESGTTQVRRYPLIDQSPGTLNLALNNAGALDIESLTNSGIAKVVFAYPFSSSHRAKILLGVDSGSALYITRVDDATMAIDTTFGVEGLYTIPNLTGLQNIMVDSKNRIIINGTSISPLAWALQIPENGDDAPTVFNMPADITSANMVYQQESGRYIVAASTNTVGTLVAFQDEVVLPATGLAVDESFNPLATGSSVAGRWNIAGSSSLYSLVVNSDDTMYTAYKNTSSGFLTIVQVLANGAGLNTAFNTTGRLVTTITPDSTAVVRIVVDSSQNVVVAASCASGTLLKAFRCSLTGGTGAEFTGSGVTSGVFSTSSGVGGSAGIALKALLEDEQGKTLLIGSNTAGGHGQMFAARLSTTGALDTTWNPSATSPDVPGMLTFGSTGNPLTPAITIMNNATINIVGNIFAVGGNGTDPIVMEIIGDGYITAVSQGQLQVAPGILDATLAETSGAYNLVTAGLLLAGYTPNKIYTYPDGSILIGASNGTATTLTRVDATFALDTTFNHGAILSLGSGTATLNDMFVANGEGQDGSIYITGANSGALWAAQISADGLTIVPVVTSSVASWTTGDAIRLAGNGDIIIAGFDGIYGAVAAFLPNGAALDPFFGTAGVYATASTNPITAMTIDNLSRMYIAYKDSSIDGSPISIMRLTPGGTLDPSFAAVPVPASNFWIATSIKMALDQENNQLVVAAQDGIETNNYLTVVRFSTIDGSGTGTNEIDMSIQVLTLSDLYIDSDQEIYIIATNVTDSKAIVARFVSTNATTIDRDLNYGEQNGIANLSIPGVTSIGAGSLNPDGRTYLVGVGSGTAYMARVFNNNYFTEVSQAASSAILGELDYSYGTAGAAINYAGDATSASDNQEARAIVPLSKGTDSMTIIGDSINAWTVRVLSDGTNDPSYGSGQGIEIAKQISGDEIVQGMVFDGSGNAIVFGSNSVAGGYVKSVLPSGAMNPLFNSSGNPVGTVYISQISSVNAVAQLKNGNFVYVGYKDTIGMIGMLNAAGMPISSFNTTGFISLGINVTSVSVDADDNFYVSFATTASSVISASVAKYNAAGVLVADYGTAGIVSSIMTNLASSADIRLVLDPLGKVVIAASSNANPASIGVVRLNLDGSVDLSFNMGLQLNIPFDGDTTAVVTSLVALQNGDTLVAGYQYDPIDVDNNDYEFVASVTRDGVLDVNFNADGSVPGILTFQVAAGEQTGRNVWGMGIQNNGQIILAGSEGPQAGGEIPLTIRVNGYPGVRAVPQFVGAVPAIPSDVNPTFGIAFTIPAMLNLVEGGYTAVDSRNRVLVGGRTEAPNTFVVARFLEDGSLDTGFGANGVSQSPELTTLVSGSFITLDGSDNIYIGGITSDSRLIVAKFLSASGHLDTAGFNSAAVSPLVPGVAQSLTTAQVISGGYVAIDYIESVIVGGMTADNKLSIARFTTLGAQDSTFGTGGVAQTGVLSTLHHGGYVATAVAAPELFPELNDNSVYVGASTYADTLLVAKFNRSGVLESTYSSPGVGFGVNGIAESATITNLVDGGSVALDSDRSVIVGGYTSDQKFVAAKFLASGEFAPEFGTHGIAYSSPLFSINSFGDITIDSNDKVLLGGMSTAYDGISNSLVVARLTVDGRIDSTFGTDGVSTSGTIADLVAGGFVAVNILNNVFVGGYDGTKLVVAGLFSGSEIFINNPEALPILAKKLYLYGNDRARFKDFLGIHPFAELITNSVDRTILIDQVSASLDEYAIASFGQPGFNLACSLLQIWNLKLTQLQAFLKIEGIDNAQVDAFFDTFRIRALFLQEALASYSNKSSLSSINR